MCYVQGMLHVKDQPELSKQLVESEQKGTISVLNLLYDAMPIEFITLIVTEFGLIPPTSVPVILREKQDDEAVVAGT
jgi:translation initiation factor 2B subunit (eIF-2B alpha/beta/delta family)